MNLYKKSHVEKLDPDSNMTGSTGEEEDSVCKNTIQV